MQIHHVADHQRRTLVAAQHAGGEGPRRLQLADILRGDLIQRRIALVVVGDGRHHHIGGIGLRLDQIVAVGALGGGGFDHQR